MKPVLGLLLALLAVTPAQAAEVVMAVGRSLPPYVIVDEWRGLEYDVVREALALEGHTLTPRFVSFARVVRELEGGMVDAAMTMRPDSGVKAHYSDSHVTYRNYAITLASRNLTIKSINDLGGKSVLAFQNASLYLGPAYKAVADANPHYREEARQVMQPILLFMGRVDVVVADRFIFGWFAHDPEARGKVDTGQGLRFHPIFPATDYHVAFRDPALRDSFNRGLKKLRDNGTYARIVERYSPYLKDEGGG
jgi:polar amino acid transport system substrate-binding protein